MNIIKNIITNINDATEIFIKVLKMDQREEVVGMITLDYYNRINGIIELMHGKKAFGKIGTDDLFNKAFMLDAFSIILAYNSSRDLNKLESKYFIFNKFLIKEAKRLQMDIYDHLIILDQERIFSLKNNSWISN